MTDKARARRAIIAALVGVLATAIFAGAALGEDVEDITISEGQTVKKDYPALVGPQPPVCFFGGGDPTCRNTTNCKANTTHWCDTSDLTIDVPASYTSSDFFKIDIQLSWTSPPEGNDVDLFVYRTTGSQVLSSSTSNNPEKVSLQDPPERKYVILVANIDGTNSGYALTVSFVPQKIDAFEEAEEFSFGSPSRSESSDDSFDAGLFDLPPAPAPEGAIASSGPRPVERPGPDGSLTRRTFAVLAASSPPGQNSRLPFIASSIVAALVAAGLGVFLYLRGKGDSDF
jgi:hypothetical protein